MTYTTYDTLSTPRFSVGIKSPKNKKFIKIMEKSEIKKTKLILMMLAMLLAAFSQLRAELPTPLITVDTVFKIQTNGSKGAVFLPDGNSVIMMCQDTPYLIDANTWQVIRQFEYKAGEETESPIVSKDGKYLFAQSNSGLAVWNIQTGKIIKYLRNCVDYCLSPDGLKLYQTIINDKNKSGVIRVYDLKNLEEIEVFCNHDFGGAEEIAISPDGQTVAVGVSHEPIGSEEDNINRSVILIDLNKKTEFERIESTTPWIANIQFSPDGKYLLFEHNVINNSICSYNILTKNKKNYYADDIVKIVNSTFNCKHPQVGGAYFLDNNTIALSFQDPFENFDIQILWKLESNLLYKMIKFSVAKYDINGKKLLLCSYLGDLALLDLDYVSIIESLSPENYVVKYSIDKLEYYSDKSYLVESSIYDTTGKQIINLGMQTLIAGNNTIKVSQSLPIGMYILTIKSDKEQFSYKFIVE